MSKTVRVTKIQLGTVLPATQGKRSVERAKEINDAIAAFQASGTVRVGDTITFSSARGWNAGWKALKLLGIFSIGYKTVPRTKMIAINRAGEIAVISAYAGRKEWEYEIF